MKVTRSDNPNYSLVGKWLRNELYRKNNYLIVRNKEIKDLPVNTEIVKQGVKYSIIKSPEV